MSSHYIYINCPACHKSESIYTGDVTTEDFNDEDWEGSSIETRCIECVANDKFPSKSELANPSSEAIN